MIVYKCIISGDEIFNDSFNFKEEGGFYVLKAKYITVKQDDVDDSAIGGNPSAEEEAEGTEGATESGLDVALASRLVETGFGSKKEYQVYMKDYTKAIFGKLTEQGKLSTDDFDALKKAHGAGFLEMSKKFKELSFYTGESMNVGGIIPLVDWVDEEIDGQTQNVPYFYCYKAGLVAEKF